MKRDFRHHLLLQIEMLRGDLSYQELSERLGDIDERWLARYIAGKYHLSEAEFKEVAKALAVPSDSFARAWASSLGLSISENDATSWMVCQAHMRWREHSRIARVPSRPSPTIIRAKYADQNSWEPPPLRFGAQPAGCKITSTPENRARFARAHAILVESLHGCMSAREIGAICGISASRASHLMVGAAYTSAGSKKIDHLRPSVPLKNEAICVKQLYAWLQFFARQKFHELAKEAQASGRAGSSEESL